MIGCQHSTRFQGIEGLLNSCIACELEKVSVQLTETQRQLAKANAILVAHRLTVPQREPILKT